MSFEPITVPLQIETPSDIPLYIDPARLIPGPPGPPGTTDYEELENRPSINGVELIGNKTSAELGIDQTYIHNQTIASDIWRITHDLGKFPSVDVVDSGGTVVEGDIQYIDESNLVITFSGAFSGTAYLN